MQPLLLVVEGQDGSGKTTSIEYISKVLRHKGHSVKVVKAMGSGDLGHVIREKLFEDYFDDHTCSLACCLAILDAYNKALQYIDQGHTVIFDRFIGSYYAYNIKANQECFADILFNTLLLNKKVVHRQPDHYFFIDVSTDTAVERISQRSDNSIIDNKPYDYHKVVNNAFIEFSTMLNYNSWTLIDNNRDISYLKLQLEKSIDQLFKTTQEL